MLGNLPTTEIAKQPNGEFLTTDVTGNNTNFLFVFVTPTIIDPAGNRVNPAGRVAAEFTAHFKIVSDSAPVMPLGAFQFLAGPGFPSH